MSGSTTEFEPLHKEHPAKGKVNLAYSHKPSAARSFVFNFIRVLGSYISLLCAVYPTPCAILLFAFIGLALFGLGEAIFNPRVKYGYVVHDHSNLKSIYDFKLNNVDHWCLRGDNDSCRCEDPFQPISRAEHNSWKVAFKTNRKIVKALEDDPTSDIDVAFVGESVVEEMDGRWMGVSRGGSFKTLKQIFDANFNKKKGASLNAVALGIAGDTAPNVLFRLLHGEMSQKLHPKIYWLSLGMNDLSRMQCSEEVVVLGILRVVEEIINNTNSYVVINSLFPMSEMRGAAYPMLHDMNEAFAQNTNVRGFRNRGRGSTYNPALVAPQAAQAPTDNNNSNGRRRLQYRQPQQYPPQQYPPQQYPPQQYPPQQYPPQQYPPQQYQQYPQQQYPQQQYQYPPPQQGYPPQQYPQQQYPPHQYAPQQGYQRQPMRPPTDSELEQQAEKEEQAREEEWKRQHHQRLFHQNKVNSNLVEQHRIRKHWSDRRLPLWSSITAINRELKKYVAHHQEQERVFFFDSTPIFATRQDQKHFALRLDTISPKGHPTELGFKSWEKAVAARAETLVQLWKDNHPTYTPPQSGADPFDMDSLLDNIPHMEDDITDDLNFFKNVDDAWMDRLGEDDEVGGDDDVEDDEYNDDEYNDDAESGDDEEESGDDDGEESNDEESGDDGEESNDEESEDGGDHNEEVEEESEDGADDENDTDDDTPEVESKQTVVEPKVAPKTIDTTTTRGKKTKTSAHKTHKAPATKTKTTPKKRTAKKPKNTP